MPTWKIGLITTAVLVASTLVFASDQKSKVLLYCTSDGRVGVEFFENSDRLARFRDELEREYELSCQLWEVSGKRGPEPDKPFTVTLKDVRESEKIGAAFLASVEAAKKKHRKKIEALQDAACERTDALLGVPGNAGSIDRIPWETPPTASDRRIPEKTIGLIHQPTILMGQAIPFRLCFWARAEPRPGDDPSKPVRLVAEFRMYLHQEKGVIDGQYVELMRKYGRFEFSRNVLDDRHEAYLFVDSYVTEIVPDGQWRYYRIPIAWEPCRIKNVGILNRMLAFSFRAADPAIYSFDDVLFDWDTPRMTFAERENALAPVMTVLRQHRRAETVKRGNDRTVEERFADAKIRFPLRIAEIVNGDFNQVFDDFVLGWKMTGAEDDADPAALPVRTTRVAGNRPETDEEKKQRELAEKNTRGRRGGGKETEPAEPGLVGRWHVRCDATAWDPDAVPAGAKKKSDTEAAGGQNARIADPLNGTFETDANSDGWPDGWNNAGNRAVAKTAAYGLKGVSIIFTSNGLSQITGRIKNSP